MFPDDDQAAEGTTFESPGQQRHLRQKIVFTRPHEFSQQPALNRTKPFGHKGHGNGQMKVEAAPFISVGAAEQWTEAFVQAFLDASPTNLALLDESGAILHVNRAWRCYADRSGLTDDAQGMDYIDAWEELVGSADEANDVAQGIQQILAGKAAAFNRHYYCAGATAAHWVLMRAARFDLPGAGGFRILVTHEDITSNLQAIAAIADAAQGKRNVLNHIFAFVAVLAPDGTLLEVNRPPLEAADVTLDEVEGKRFWDCPWWNYDTHVQAQLRRTCKRVAAGDPMRCDLTVNMAGARKMSLDLMLTPLKDGDGKVTQIVASAVDITRRKSMEEALRDLSGRLIGVQEAERRRIARELHDDLNQQMAILSIELQELDQAIPRRKHDLHARIQGLWNKAQEISAEIHRLSYQLHPSKLEHLGLAAAVKDFCEEISVHQNLKVDFCHRGFPNRIPKDVALCVFRIAQEALTNVVKHSGAREAMVVLEKTDQAVNLSVSDDGCGFNAGSANDQGGLGLISMRERLRLVGGDISIHSRPAQGTRINVSVPLMASA